MSANSKSICLLPVEYIRTFSFQHSTIMGALGMILMPLSQRAQTTLPPEKICPPEIIKQKTPSMFSYVSGHFPWLMGEDIWLLKKVVGSLYISAAVLRTGEEQFILIQLAFCTLSITNQYKQVPVHWVTIRQTYNKDASLQMLSHTLHCKVLRLRTTQGGWLECGRIWKTWVRNLSNLSHFATRSKWMENVPFHKMVGVFIWHTMGSEAACSKGGHSLVFNTGEWGELELELECLKVTSMLEYLEWLVISG